MKRYVPGFGLALTALVLALVYAALVPPGEGPDEPGHMAYVRLLASESRLPVPGGTPAEAAPGAGHHPPLAYVLMAAVYARLPPEARGFEPTPNPAFVWAGGMEPNAFFHGSQELWPWGPGVWGWRAARAVNGLLLAMAVFATYAAGLAASGQVRIAVAAAALLAGNPQVLFTSGLVSNDPLVLTLSATLVWVVMTAGRWPALARAGLLGLLVGLGLLTKLSAAVLALPAVVVMVAHQQHGWRWLRDLAVFALVVLVVAGWWFGRNLVLLGDPLGLRLFQATYATQPFAWGDVQAWRGGLDVLHQSAWARFGWNTLTPPGWVFGLIGAGELATLAGLVVWLRRGGWAAWTARHAALVVLVAGAAAWLISFVATAGLVGWQGRLLFPAYPALALAGAAGLTALGGARLTALATGALLALALWSPASVIRPAYRWEAIGAQQAQRDLGQVVYGRYAEPWNRGLELRGVHVPGAALPGEALNVTLTWHALERIGRDWTVFVHLIDQAGTLVSDSDAHPRAGAYPTTAWAAGDWIQDPVVVPIPAELAPGRYQLLVGLYDPVTQERQRVWDAAGRAIGDSVDLGWVMIGAVP